MTRDCVPRRANAKPAAKEAAAETLEWSNAEDGVSRYVEALLEAGRLSARDKDGH